MALFVTATVAVFIFSHDYAVLSFDAASDAAEFSTAVSAFLNNRRSIQPPTTTDLYADFIGIQWMLSAQLLLLAAMFTRP